MHAIIHFFNNQYNDPLNTCTSNNININYIQTCFINKYLTIVVHVNFVILHGAGQEHFPLLANVTRQTRAKWDMRKRGIWNRSTC